MRLSPEQLGQLHRAELIALIRTRWGEVGGDAGSYPAGAALHDDSTGWILTLGAGPRALGGALVWAAAKGVSALHVFVDSDAGVLARQATRFDRDITVWQIDEAQLAAADPEPVAPEASPSADAQVLARELEVAGLDVVVESGIVRAEVLGLEIARVIEGPHHSNDADLGPASSAHLEAGVGRFDREMSALMHRGEPPMDAVIAAADTVRIHRHRGAPPHPLRDLCRERWIRHSLMAEPGAVGATQLEPIGTTLDRPNLRDPWPALAVGESLAGSPLVVACTVGIDLDALVLAADTRAVMSPDAELVMASPEPLPASVRAVSGWLARPARFVEIAAPWE